MLFAALQAVSVTEHAGVTAQCLGMKIEYVAVAFPGDQDGHRIQVAVDVDTRAGAGIRAAVIAPQGHLHACGHPGI